MSLLLLHFQNLSSTNLIILHGNNDAKHSTNKLTFEVSVFSSKSQTTSLEVTRMNRPLSLCFASTIQNVEGSTLQTVVQSTANIWTPGMVYAAMSKVNNKRVLYYVKFSLQTNMKLEISQLEKFLTHWILSKVIQPSSAPCSIHVSYVGTERSAQMSQKGNNIW